MEELDEKKRQALETTWQKVNADFGAIFSTLLPGTTAKLEPPEGETFVQGKHLSAGMVWGKGDVGLRGNVGLRGFCSARPSLSGPLLPGCCCQGPSCGARNAQSLIQDGNQTSFPCPYILAQAWRSEWPLVGCGRSR